MTWRMRSLLDLQRQVRAAAAAAADAAGAHLCSRIMHEQTCYYSRNIRVLKELSCCHSVVDMHGRGRQGHLRTQHFRVTRIHAALLRCFFAIQTFYCWHACTYSQQESQTCSMLPFHPAFVQ
jgi:hypothetical protein